MPLRSALVALAALLGVPVPAQAAPRPLRLTTLAEHAHGQVVSDGRRWAAYPVTPSLVRVFDDATGRRFAVPIPAGCDDRSPVVGAGQLAFSCSGETAPEIVLIDAVTGAQRELPGQAAFFSNLGYPDQAGRVGVSGVGRVWIRGFGDGIHFSSVGFLNWHTGEVRGDPGPNAVPDLDRPALRRPLCSVLPPGVRFDREYFGFDGTTGEEYFGFDGTVGAWIRPPRRVLVQRCGQPGVFTLDSLRGDRAYDDDLQVGASWITWLTLGRGRTSRAWASSVRSGSRLTVPVRNDSGFLDVAHTTRRAFVSTRDVNGEAWTVRAGELPAQSPAVPCLVSLGRQGRSRVYRFFDGRQLHGRTLAEARRIAGRSGCSVRPVSVDGRAVKLDRSIRPERLNVDLAHGVIARAYSVCPVPGVAACAALTDGIRRGDRVRVPTA